MDSIPNNSILEFRPDTLNSVRKQFNLDQPGRVEEAINILQEWIRKQEHFTHKDFDKEYLEKLIIINKGLLERAKSRLDRICTLRTLMPDFCKPLNVMEDLENLDVLTDAILPKLTPDDYRIYVLKNTGKEFTSSQFLDYYKRLIVLFQYLLKHDYNAGYIFIYDYLDTNLMELVTKFNISDFRQAATLVMEGYGLRVKGIYLLTQSKIIDTFVGLIKPLLNPKVSGRIKVFNNVESLKTVIPVEYLPEEYGGQQQSVQELHKKWLNVLSSEEHLEYMKKTNEARTDETKRKVDKFNAEYLGMPGTFRTLNVD